MNVVGKLFVENKVVRSRVAVTYQPWDGKGPYPRPSPIIGQIDLANNPFTDDGQSLVEPGPCGLALENGEVYWICINRVTTDAVENYVIADFDGFKLESRQAVASRN